MTVRRAWLVDANWSADPSRKPAAFSPGPEEIPYGLRMLNSDEMSSTEALDVERTRMV